MKKNLLKILSALFCAVSLLLVASCSDLQCVENSDSTDCKELSGSVLCEKDKELALYALSGNYSASMEELEESVLAFASRSNSEINRAAVKETSISLAKSTAISVEKNIYNNSSRSITADFDEEIPIYYYEITNDTETDVAIATSDRRLGLILAYIEDCTVEEIDNDDDSPLNFFFECFGEYAQNVADFWNNTLTDDYLKSVNDEVESRSAQSQADTVIKSNDYTYDEWKYNYGNDKYRIPANIAKNIGQGTFFEIIASNLGYKVAGCGATSVMHLLCFHRYPKTIETDVIDSVGTNYKGRQIWSSMTDSSMNWKEGASNFSDSINNHNYLEIYNVFSSELEYLTENPDITTSNLKARYLNLRNDAEVELNKASSLSDNAFLNKIYKLDLKARFDTYERLKKKSYSSYENAMKYLVKNTKKSAEDIEENVKEVNEELYRNLCALYYQTVVGCKSKPSANGTVTTLPNRIAYLKQLGFLMDSTANYSYTKVKNSIDNGYPVLCRGQTGKYVDSKGVTYDSEGHSWVIDAYANLSCEAKNKKTGSIGNLTADYVHCDWGWDNSKHGYYLSGVFDSQYLPLYVSGSDYKARRNAMSEESNAAYFFQHDFEIVTNIRPES